MINVFNDVDLKNFYENKQLWKGCFGGMSIITHDYLTYINDKYDFSKLLECVLNRYNRQSFERVIACLLQINKSNESLLGDIHDYSEEYSERNCGELNFDNKYVNKHLPMTKNFTGR